MPFRIDQPLVISKTDARRLAIVCQHLAAPQQVANEANVMVTGRASGQRLWAITDAHLPQERLR
ncbi:hypothetical protein [Brevibacillus nitrificans]|uniref:hypothetical protein n=1 Tax=Brevibacillus nitrificans TaxID=651560 RepID=UPI002858F4B1|nr:hypothetical protein [Brevibacillus nitrificans]MDR7316591.1 hypothetical protein [Brevibacillus nitrificans]